jgi:hypothetical protein
MENGNDHHKKPHQPLENRNKNVFVKLMESNELTKLMLEYFYKEGKGLRDGWFAALILVAVALYLGNEHGAKSKDEEIMRQTTTIEELTSEASIDSSAYRSLNQKWQDEQSELTKLNADYGKEQTEAENAKNVLASWILLAESTNAPLTTRLDVLNGSLSKMFDLKTLEPDFDVYFDEQLMTSNFFTSLPPAGKILFSIVNKSSLPLDGVEVIVRSVDYLQGTGRWRTEKEYLSVNKEGQPYTNKISGILGWSSEKIISRGYRCNTDLIQISFNSQLKTASGVDSNTIAAYTQNTVGYLNIPVEVEVSAKNSKTKIYNIVITVAGNM